jgi:hypothetical protein
LGVAPAAANVDQPADSAARFFGDIADAAGFAPP